VSTILNQTNQDFSIYEINYGGGEDSVLDGFDFKNPHKFISEKLENHADAMNLILDAAFSDNCDCVFNTNLDDFYEETRFDVQLKYIKEGYDLVSSDFRYIEEINGSDILRFNKNIKAWGDVKENLDRDHNMIAHPCVAYSKKFWENNRYISSEIPREDLLLWKRSINNGFKFWICDEILLNYRLHTNQITGNNSSDSPSSNSSDLPLSKSTIINSHKTKKIKFFASYCSDEQIYNNILSSWAKGKTEYKNLIITKDSDYDYAVVFNKAVPDLSKPKEKVIGFSHEPRMALSLDINQEINLNNKVGSYFISNSNGLSSSFKSGFSFVLPAEYGKSENEEYSHENKMSMILSMSKFMPGHIMRHQLLRRILDTDMDIHFYAEGLNKIYFDPRVKEFNWGLFNIPYENYQTQIVIENIIDDMWASEKLSNCIIKETFPIYYGSKKVSEIFYGPGVIPMLGDDVDKNMEIISEYYYSSLDLKSKTSTAKNKMYSEYNLMEFIYQHFNKILITS
jgi:hypothetical protein